MTGVLGSPVLMALLAAACAWTAVRGYARLRSDPLDGLEVEDLALVRSRKQIERSGGPLGALGRRLAPVLASALGAQRLERTRSRIQQAGNPDGLTLQSYLERKARLLAIFGAGALVLVLRGQWLLALLAVAGAWAIPDLALRSARKARQSAIDRDLPDFLDVLAVTVSAGLSFRAALERVAARYEGPLSEEVTQTLRQMDVGEARRTAFERLRRRNDSAALDQFVVALLQAEELGTPLTEALDQIAVEMRRATAQRARQQASRTSPRVALVVTMVMVPGALVLLVVSLLLSSGVDLGNLGG
ncbi:type II secretion system F family protein [Angustibacter sp. Root456]|uniref:type II secretion system F family protein n=1 Tax=Angustibacter sp. Root456 TaxID=1736539 RepID=UPI000B2361E7|nr:type II secretion system F family protein [Angustibacter sp. Root456]